MFRDVYSTAVYFRNQTETPHIHFCSFENIGGIAVQNATASIAVDARYNYWGDSGGPSAQGPGDGEPVSTYVDFAPWLADSSDYGGDSDNDGMPDSFEVIYGLNPYISDDSVSDLDNDGFTNYQEYVAGTDPSNEYSVPSSPSIVFYGIEGAVMTLTATATSDYGDIVSYEWNLGDGSTASGSSVEHIYAESGVYIVSLEVTDELGIKSTQSGLAEVQDSSPNTNFISDKNEGTSPLTVQFTDQTTSYDDIVSWSWSFGDGSELSTSTNPSHVFLTQGEFTVTLTVVDEDGSSANVSHLIAVVEKIVGDIDGDNDIDLNDAILSLQILTNRQLPEEQNVNLDGDVDLDGKIGLPEVLYILNEVGK